MLSGPSIDQRCVDPRASSSSWASWSSLVATPPARNADHYKTIFLVRHAEAEHNILEKQAVEEAIASGVMSKYDQEKARKAVLQNPCLKDSPLSRSGRLQAQRSSQHLQELLRLSSRDLRLSFRREESKVFQPPQVVLVSPLRRALMTATELFHQDGSETRFVALEVLREKRTGLACDERSSVDELQEEFPHVDFTNLFQSSSPEPGEDNSLVRERTKEFLEQVLVNVEEEVVAVVSHKGWLRELRHTLKSQVDLGELEVDFDVKEWDETLFNNAEIRVAEFGYRHDQLVSIVSRSVDSAISSIVACGEDKLASLDGYDKVQYNV